MDLIIAVVNSNSRRKKVEKFLLDSGLDDYLALDSNGTFGMLTSDSAIRRGIDSVFDDKFDRLNRGKIIGVINYNSDSTKDIIDEIYKIISISKERFNTGIAFSIPINNILNIERRK